MEIKILHLSDLHFGSAPKDIDENEIPLINEVVDSFISKMNETDGKELDPNFIIVSGDISNTADVNEFNDATNFFKKLIEVFPNTQILFVPGNHDKKRFKKISEIEKLELYKDLKQVCVSSEKSKQDELIKELTEIIEGGNYDAVQVAVSKIEESKEKALEVKTSLDSLFDSLSSLAGISEAEDIKKEYDLKRENLFKSAENIDNYCVENFNEYTTFVNLFYSTIVTRFIPIKIRNKALSNQLVKIVNFEEQKIIFVLLNTAWLCQNSKRDPGKLTLGDSIIKSIKKELQAKSDNLVISVMHHCPNSFQRNDILDRGLHMSNLGVINQFSDFILSGHEHGSHTKKPDFLDNEAQLLTAGTFYTGKKDEYSCSYYRINPKAGKVSMRNIKLNSTLSISGEYYWTIEKEYVYPFTKPTELKNINENLQKENNEIVAKIKRLKWLYKKRKASI